MQYRRLGKSGLQVSEFSLGSWVTFDKQVHEGDALALMTAAYDAGINFFDNAEGYESRRLGEGDGRGVEKARLGPRHISSSRRKFSGAGPSPIRRASPASIFSTPAMRR